MTNVFLHGGPGLPEYLETFFAGINLENCVFYNQNQNIAKIDQALDELHGKVSHLKDFTLVGHSWGGILALEYIKRAMSPYPKALVLISTPISHLITTASEEAIKNLNSNPPNIYDIFLSKKEAANEACQHRLNDIFEPFNMGTLQKIEENYLSDFDLRPTMKNLSIPTLVTYGGHDIRVPAEIQSQYRLLNQRIETQVVAGAGHFPFIEDNNCYKVTKILKNFLNNTNSIK